MTANEILDKLSTEIYCRPLLNHRNDKIRDLTDPLSVIMLVIDFDTERLMNGICDVFSNSTGMYIPEIISALNMIGAATSSKKLTEMASVAVAHGMNWDSLQKNISEYSEFEILSFSSIHGMKWDEALNKIREIDDDLEMNEVYDCLERFAAEHQAYLELKLELPEDANGNIP